MLDRRATLQSVLDFLDDDGISLESEGAAGNFVVAERSVRKFWHSPVIFIPVDLLSEYIADLSREFQNSSDPWGEALSMTQIHLMEYLGTDHGTGANATTRLALRRSESGQVELWVEQDIPRQKTVEGQSADEFRWVSDRTE